MPTITPVRQKQKATDHIDEELRLAIFKTLKLSQIFFSHFVRISERVSKRHQKKSQSQLYWSISHFIRALLVSFWFLFLWRFIFSLHSLLSWPVKVSDIFYLMKMKGTFRSVVWNSQPHPYVQMVLRALAWGISMQITRWKSTTQRTFKCLETPLLNNALAHYCLLNQMTQMDKDCDTYDEYICIYGPEIGSYCFSSNSDVGLVENVTENIRWKKEFAKFRMSQIEEGKHVYHIYTFVLNADVSNRGDIGMQIVDKMIIYSWSRTRHCWHDFASRLSNFEYFFDDCQIICPN